VWHSVPCRVRHNKPLELVQNGNLTDGCCGHDHEADKRSAKKHKEQLYTDNDFGGKEVEFLHCLSCMLYPQLSSGFLPRARAREMIGLDRASECPTWMGIVGMNEGFKSLVTGTSVYISTN